MTLAEQVADNLDSDAVNGTFVAIRGASVAAASENLTFDFAGPIVIGDFVWRDLNGNGVQDDGAGSALSGVVVASTDCVESGTVIVYVRPGTSALVVSDENW